MIGAALAWLSSAGGKHWKQIGVGLLIVALAITYAWGSAGWRKADQHKAAHATTIANYKQAQKDAQAAFDAKIAAFQAQNRRLNDEADKKVADTTIVYRDRVVRMRSAPAQCIAGGAAVPGPNLPQGSDGPGAGASLPDYVVILRSDADTCAANTARLEAAREWALGMQAD